MMELAEQLLISASVESISVFCTEGMAGGGEAEAEEMREGIGAGSRVTAAGDAVREYEEKAEGVWL